MPFQRSYSKVWWGSDNTLPNSNGNKMNEINYQYYGQQSAVYKSLDHNLIRPSPGNLSRIQEADDENSSKLWLKHDSPGSLRSQDSGFSDNDESHSIGDRKTPLITSSPRSAKSDSNESNCSPSSIRTIETPPTVIRRPTISVNTTPNRLSLSAPNSPFIARRKGESGVNGNTDDNCDLLNQLDRISFINTTPKKPDNLDSSLSGCECTFNEDKSLSSSTRRRRMVGRKTRRSLIPTDSLDTLQSPPRQYNNETVYLGGPFEGDANNNTIKSERDVSVSPLKTLHGNCFTASTSTPKSKGALPRYGCTLPYIPTQYENPLLNGHTPALQCWIDDIRMSYEHEVMSTLQTKSIVMEAFKNLKVTTHTVMKIIRQLQQRSVALQTDFDRIEKILIGDRNSSLHTALMHTEILLESVDDFTKILERRSVFFAECRRDRKRFEDNIEQINLISKDTRISLEKQHYIQKESLCDDIQVLKRHLLITLRLVFEKLVKVIVQSVEQSKCDLILRANINMIATLSNMEYEGFASLSDAFLQNETVRALLMVCLENKLSSVRALALRALATICCTSGAISQMSQAGGIEIIRDALQRNDDDKKSLKRTESEKREAVSLLTQITAPWHGEHCSVEGLKDCAEIIVEGITDLIKKTNCFQTLLLCAASLNNLSRVEMTSVYSIMSNETIIKLKATVESRPMPEESIFLYEQIVAMLYNMSGNKKCHSHLANGVIINFITFIFQAEFYRKYISRAEVDAQRRTIKKILHIFARLIHESSLGQEILEQNFVPIFSKVVILENDDDYGQDISALARQLSENCMNKSFNRSQEGRGSTSSTSGMKFNLTRQESYV